MSWKPNQQSGWATERRPDSYVGTSSIPLHTFKPKIPLLARVASVRSLVRQGGVGDVREVVLDHKGKLLFWEGQSIGVIPPGISPKTGQPYLNRLYSICSTRYGDDGKGQTVSVCVRRQVQSDANGTEDPSRKGVCSNFLCDARPGDEVLLTGPSGKVMIMPEQSPSTDLIMIATGTGLAPFRGFLRRLFVESSPAAQEFRGLAWLIFGAANRESILYEEELRELQKCNPDSLRITYALSREQRSAGGEKMYVQSRVEERGDEIFDRMSRGAHLFFCGVKGMMPGILQTLERVAHRRGVVWSEVSMLWKQQGQWHVEVY